MNRTVTMMGRAALVPLTVLGIRYAWKAFSPAISEAETADRIGTALRERFDALKWRIEGSRASKAGEAHKWRALQARVQGVPAVNRIGNAVGSTSSRVEARLARMDAAQARRHKAAAMARAGEAERRTWNAIAAWMGDTWAMLLGRFGALSASVDTSRLQAAASSAREVWAEHGWGMARQEREARKRRNNLSLGAVAGLGIGAGAVYLLSLRNRHRSNGYESLQTQGMYYTGNGQASQHAVDRAMRQTEASLDAARTVADDAPLSGWAEQSEAIDTVHASELGEAWIVIPKEQWAEFIQRMSDSHQGWLVRVENEGNLSPDETPVNEQRFSGMQLEPSMARPGVRIYAGALPEGFFEHVIPDLRMVEHLPSDEEGYQGLRLTTTVDRVTLRFTDPGQARDPLAE